MVSRARRTFLWMAGLSLVTLVLGVLREFAIARELRASGAADLFFRGLVVIGTARSFGMALFRARWIPVDPAIPARRLMQAERGTLMIMSLVGLVVLAVLVGPAALLGPTGWVLAGAVVLAVYGSAVRALAERAGHERRGFVLEWALPLGAIAGALLLPGTTLGPTAGIFAGLLLGLLWLLPLLAPRTGPEGQVVQPEDSRRTRVLLLDALIYGNLALLDTAFSPLYAEGQFALLNYGYLFVNAAMMAPTAAATVVSLRLATGGDAAMHAVLRRWSVIGGLATAAIVMGVGLCLTWGPVAARVDARVGWALAVPAGTFVLWSVPYAGLRMANTIGRQFVVATEPERVLRWDVVGQVGRALVLAALAMTWGIVASPLALVFAELVQVAAWWRGPRASEASST